MERDVEPLKSARAKVHDDQEVPKDLSGTREGRFKEAALSKIVKDISDKRSKRYVYQIDESGRMVQRAIEGPFLRSPAISGPQTPKATVGSSRGKRNRNYMYRFDESGVLRDLGLGATEASGTEKSEVTVRRPPFQDRCPVTTREDSTKRSEGPVWTYLFERPRPATPQPQSQKHTPQPTPQNGLKPAEKEKQKTGIQAMQEALAALHNIGSQWKEVNKTIAAARDKLAVKEPSTTSSQVPLLTSPFQHPRAATPNDQVEKHITQQPAEQKGIELAQKEKEKEKTATQADLAALDALYGIKPTQQDPALQAEMERDVYAFFGIKPIQQDPAMQAIMEEEEEEEEEVNASNATPPTQQNTTRTRREYRPWRAQKASRGRNQQNAQIRVGFNSRIMIGRLWRGRIAVRIGMGESGGCGEFC